MAFSKAQDDINKKRKEWEMGSAKATKDWDLAPRYFGTHPNPWIRLETLPGRVSHLDSVLTQKVQCWKMIFPFREGIGDQ